MVLELNPTFKVRLEHWARLEYPKECCGVLLGQLAEDVVRVKKVVQARNANVERAGDRYEIPAEDMLRADALARLRHWDIVGIWHTHPDHPARPSITDRALAWDGWSYLILAVNAQGVQAIRSWRLCGPDFAEEQVCG